MLYLFIFILVNLKTNLIILMTMFNFILYLNLYINVFNVLLHLLHILFKKNLLNYFTFLYVYYQNLIFLTILLNLIILHHKMMHLKTSILLLLNIMVNFLNHHYHNLLLKMFIMPKINNLYMYYLIILLNTINM